MYEPERYFIPDAWRPAPLWRRLGAIILDLSIAFALFSLGVFVAEWVGLIEQDPPGSGEYSSFWLLPLLLFPFLTVYLGFPAWRGDTPAKLLFRIRVVMFDTGYPPGLHIMLYRLLAWFIDWGLIGLLMVVTTTERRRVGDRWANTIVVLADPEKRKGRYFAGHGVTHVNIPKRQPEQPGRARRRPEGNGIRLSGKPPER